MNVHALQQQFAEPEQRVAPFQEHEPTEEQTLAIDLLRGPQKHTCLVGGSRSGKTSIFVYAVVARALRAEGSRHLIVRFRANAVFASVVHDTFPKVLRMWYPGVHARSRQGFFEFENGSQIWFGGLDEEERVEKILGQEYATIFPNECSQIPYSSILVLRTRLAQPGTGLKLRGYYDLNPTSKSHWTNQEFGEKRDPVTKLLKEDPEDYARMFMNPEGNRKNLDPSYLQSLRSMPKKFRERFYEGKYVDDAEGALWTTDGLELCREDQILPDPAGKRLADFRRIVVGVDPSGARSKYDVKRDEIGIVVAGKRHGNTATVLEDATMLGSPKEWGMRVAAMFKKWRADGVVAEANYGGAMVQSTIQAISPNIPVKLVSASRGKHVRAEPVSALYDDGKVRHSGRLDKLEEELCGFTTQGYVGDSSPNRADACVWALTELMLGEQSRYTLAHIK